MERAGLGQGPPAHDQESTAVVWVQMRVADKEEGRPRRGGRGKALTRIPVFMTEDADA